ncbi:MAG: ABC transporter ATP-binding protein [Chloroflexi bacterium]|nr:MAG: ABC transporter ATP-binding protein [Chloroflexota bacterium]
MVALKGIDISIAPGSFVSIVGVSGCGKSTLLQLVAGLQAPARGEVFLAGKRPFFLRQQKKIGWMSQQAALLPWRTARENIQLPLQVNRKLQARDAISPDELLQIVKLHEFADAYPHTLSGGMQQRVALARTLAIGASLWLMDEPFAALDELTRESLTDELLTLWQQFRPTVLWVTHNLIEAVRLSDRIIVLSPRPGQVVGDVSLSLPRRRDDTSPAFQAVVRQVRSILRGAG